MKKENRIEAGNDVQHVVRVLEEKLYEHNSNRTGRHDGNLFCRVVPDERGSILAGMAGWTWAGACEITQLWVREDRRSSGLGRELLEAAEEEARSRGCSIVLVRTYSFQAPSFYQKNGCKVVNVIEDFPAEHRYFTLTKTLSS